MILCATLLYVSACAKLFYDQSIHGEIRVGINIILSQNPYHQGIIVYYVIQTYVTLL